MNLAEEKNTIGTVFSYENKVRTVFMNIINFLYCCTVPYYFYFWRIPLNLSITKHLQIVSSILSNMIEIYKLRVLVICPLESKKLIWLVLYHILIGTLFFGYLLLFLSRPSCPVWNGNENGRTEIVTNNKGCQFFCHFCNQCETPINIMKKNGSCFG